MRAKRKVKLRANRVLYRPLVRLGRHEALLLAVSSRRRIENVQVVAVVHGLVYKGCVYLGHVLRRYRVVLGAALDHVGLVDGGLHQVNVHSHLTLPGALDVRDKVHDLFLHYQAHVVELVKYRFGQYSL